MKNKQLEQLKEERKELNQEVKMIRDERRQLLREQRPLKIRLYKIKKLLNN